jgi:hypothetical protein
MPLQGNLRDFSTTQLLNLINLSKRTGSLTIFDPVPTGENDAMGNEKMAPGNEKAKVSFDCNHRQSDQRRLLDDAAGDADAVAFVHQGGRKPEQEAEID